MFDGGYLAVCTARDLGWKRVHWIVHKHSRALEQRQRGRNRGRGGNVGNRTKDSEQNNVGCRLARESGDRNQLVGARHVGSKARSHLTAA